jgi:hypothetical protein
LQIGSVKLREQLARPYGIAFANVHRVGRFRQGALYRDVLVRRHDAREPPRRFDLAVARDARVDVCSGRRGGCVMASAAARG